MRRVHKKKEVEGVVIVTESAVMLVEGLTKVAFALPLAKIQRVGVFANKGRFFLYLWEGRRKFKVVEHAEYPVLDKLYSLLV